ncbi:PA0069 family radical SAM protein [Lacipirellula limnantheis]|nr:PA0069 family radical SAM protein [Lacipirellula limnantheis]
MSGRNHRPNIRGRAAAVQPDNPYLRTQRLDDFEHVAEDADYLDSLDRPATEYLDDHSQTIVATNDSPDVSFNYSVNPYRGCAHGCSYCYARPGHEYLGMSAGIDFETKILVKRRAPELLRQFLARPQWNAETIVFSGVTDCYQPAEREFQLTRGCLAVAVECRQPIGIITKNALVARDVDLLQELAAHDAVRVAISVTTLDQSLARVMEPRTSAPAARLRAIETLSAAGVPTHVMIGPIVPGLTDSEVPAILKAASEAGAVRSHHTLLRLPSTVQDVFLDWIRRQRPNHAAKVEAFIRDARGGKLNTTEFGQRMRGTGPLAEQIEQTFRVFSKRYGLAGESPALNREAFRPPRIAGGQLPLF